MVYQNAVGRGKPPLFDGKRPGIGRQGAGENIEKGSVIPQIAMNGCAPDSESADKEAPGKTPHPARQGEPDQGAEQPGEATARNAGKSDDDSRVESQRKRIVGWRAWLCPRSSPHSLLFEAALVIKARRFSWNAGPSACCLPGGGRRFFP